MKSTVYYFQLSLFISEILKFLRYANWHSTKFWSDMIKDILAILYQKYFILCSKILLNVLHNELDSFVTMATCWVPDLSINKGFLATFGVVFWYLQIVPHMHDPASMLAQVCSLISCFASWKSLTYWNQVGGDWKRVSCHANIIFIAVGVFPVELLA